MRRTRGARCSADVGSRDPQNRGVTPVDELARRLLRKARAGTVLGMTNQPGALASLYGGTDKGTHGYLEHYRRHLGPLRHRRNLLFEIGVGGYDSPSPGGSPALWRDYLPRSVIVGLDLHPKTARLGRRVHLTQVDQSDSVGLTSVVTEYGRPNIVIDDGSHMGDHVIASFRTLWPLLQPGGLYVVEDLSTSYYPGFGGGDPPPRRSAVGLLQSLADDVQSLDPTFSQNPEWGQRRAPDHQGASGVHIYPGIAFIEKARAVGSATRGGGQQPAAPGDAGRPRRSAP